MSNISSLGLTTPTSYSSKANNSNSSSADKAISSLFGENSADQPANLEASNKTKRDYTAEFLDYMKKSPAQRLREDILKKLGLSEDDIAKMSPDKQKAVEDKIAELIKQSLSNDASSSTRINNLQASESLTTQKLSDSVNNTLLQLQQLDFKLESHV